MRGRHSTLPRSQQAPRTRPSLKVTVQVLGISVVLTVQGQQEGAHPVPSPEPTLPCAERAEVIRRCERFVQGGSSAALLPVELFGLSKSFRTGLFGKPRDAVRDVWFGIREGTCLCLLGPNGAGKSSTINALVGGWARCHCHCP